MPQVWIAISRSVRDLYGYVITGEPGLVVVWSRIVWSLLVLCHEDRASGEILMTLGRYISIGVFALVFGVASSEGVKAGGDYTTGVSSFSLNVGGMVGFAPKYEGSDDYRVIGAPIIYPSFGASDLGGRLMFREVEDIRFRLLSHGGFEAGPIAGYKFERDEDDGPLLAGLGDVEGGLVVGGYAGYRFSGVLFDVAYRDQVTGDADGYRITAALSAEGFVSPSFSLRGRVGATYADDDYMSTFFGISAAQSASSATAGVGLAQYTAEAGVKDVHVEIGATWSMTSNIDVKPRLRYKRLLGDAADSPLVESADQLSGSLSVIYRFGG